MACALPLRWPGTAHNPARGPPRDRPAQNPGVSTAIGRCRARSLRATGYQATVVSAPMMPEAAATKIAPPSTYARLANCWPPSPRWCCTIILKATKRTPRIAITKQIHDAQAMMVPTFVSHREGRCRRRWCPAGRLTRRVVAAKAGAAASRSVVAVPAAVASAVAGSARRALARRRAQRVGSVSLVASVVVVGVEGYWERPRRSIVAEALARSWPMRATTCGVLAALGGSPSRQAST